MFTYRIAIIIGSGCLVGLAGSALADRAQTAGRGMEVVQRWKLGGAGGWDYLTLDSSTHRLFVSRATRVDVVDTQSNGDGTLTVVREDSPDRYRVVQTVKTQRGARMLVVGAH